MGLKNHLIDFCPRLVEAPEPLELELKSTAGPVGGAKAASALDSMAGAPAPGMSVHARFLALISRSLPHQIERNWDIFPFPSSRQNCK